MSKPSLSLFRSNLSSDALDPGAGRRERELNRIAGTAAPKTVSLPAGKLIPMLIDAAQDDRVWLNDFADDDVRIDADLYDVLLAYQQMRQRAA